MTYTEFASKMLIALYQESELDDARPYGITFETLINRYGLPSNDRWIERLAEEWAHDGFATISNEIGPARNLEIEITGRGMRRVEGSYAGKDGVGQILKPIDQPPPNILTTQAGEPLLTEVGDYIVAEGSSPEPVTEIPATISSETWTGIETRLKRDAIVVGQIKTHITELNREVEKLDLTNQERAKVKAITEALVKLVESPEPEWKAIVELLRSPTLAAVLGLAGLLQLILKIVFGIG